MEIIKPENNWTFSWQWLVDLFSRILGDVFGFIAESEGWVEEEAAE